MTNDPEIVTRHAAYGGPEPFIQCVVRDFICGCKIVGNGTCPHPIDIRMCAEHGAAVELLEACQTMLEWLNKTDAIRPRYNVSALTKMLNAAIAKATGKAGA
jgi:hypothetical protein